jgi:hypothetical protein
VPRVSLVFQDSQQRAHRGIARGLWQPFLNLGGRCPPALKQQVHDLPLTAAQISKQALCHAYYSSSTLGIAVLQCRSAAVRPYAPAVGAGGQLGIDC